MKYNLILLLVAMAMVTLTSCDDDDPQPTNELTHANANANSPALPAGDYNTSARFTPADLTPHVGKTLESVEVRLYDLPESFDLVIYQGSNGNVPENSVIFQNVPISSLAAGVDNTIFLNSPLTITDEEDLWIGFRFSQTDARQVMGCDAGPRNSNGDRLFDGNANEWTTFLSFQDSNNPDQINWNIIGNLSE